jgi:Tol biopolymer transport system component
VFKLRQQVVTMRALLALCIVVTASCGGGGGSSDSPGTTTPETPAPITPIWVDAGQLGNSVVVLSHNTDADYNEIQKFDETGALSALTPAMVTGGKVATIKVSPDGKKIAYLADQETDNQYELFVSNADGSVNQKVSSNIIEADDDITQLEWSANSEHIIYTKSSGNRRTKNYYLASFDGQSVSPILYTDSASVEFTLESVEFVNGGTEYAMVVSSETESRAIVIEVATGAELRNVEVENITDDGSWSYDGRYYTYIVEEGSIEQLHLLDSQSGDVSVIAQASTIGHVWSPNALELAYLDFSELYIYNAALATSVSVSDFAGIPLSSISWQQFWDASGVYMIFNGSPREFGEPDDLFVVSADGTTRLISGLIGTDQEIDYHTVSSDGTVAVVTENWEIFTGNLDGTGYQNLSAPAIFDGAIRNPAWAPDNRSLVLKHRDSDISGFTVSRFDTFSRDLVTVPGDREIICFVVMDNSKSECRLFFDER